MSTLDEIKDQLNENFKNFGVKEEKRRKEERTREIERDTAGNEYKERIERAYHELELNSTAHELDAWCVECGCIHESDVVNDHWTNLNQFEAAADKKKSEAEAVRGCPNVHSVHPFHPWLVMMATRAHAPHTSHGLRTPNEAFFFI